MESLENRWQSQRCCCSSPPKKIKFDFKLFVSSIFIHLLFLHINKHLTYIKLRRSSFPFSQEIIILFRHYLQTCDSISLTISVNFVSKLYIGVFLFRRTLSSPSSINRHYSSRPETLRVRRKLMFSFQSSGACLHCSKRF